MIEHYSLPTLLAVGLVSLLHFCFMLLEMVFWTRPVGLKVFHLKAEFARQSATLAANQGLYNGFLAAGLLWGLLSTGGSDALIFFLSCIIIAGFYGAATASRSILFIQAIPAIIALISVLTLH